MEQQVLAWITHYGYAAIFVLLIFGIVGLPVPDETLLTFCGYLIYRGNFSLPLAFAAAALGSATGMTISYTLGRVFGLTVLHRYGKYLHVTPERLGRAHAWFDRVGHWALTIGYFVPGVRHLTAYAAGMSELAPQQFALFAYMGTILWVTTFLSLGYFLGERWETVERNIHRYLVIGTMVIAVIVAAYLAWRKWFAQKPGDRRNVSR